MVTILILIIRDFDAYVSLNLNLYDLNIIEIDIPDIAYIINVFHEISK